jgi:hypothetical protein
MDLENRLFALLAEGKMPQQDRCVEGKRVHILTRGGVHFAASRQRCTLSLCLGGRNNVRNAHQLQQLLTLGIVLPRHADCPP